MKKGNLWLSAAVSISIGVAVCATFYKTVVLEDFSYYESEETLSDTDEE